MIRVENKSSIHSQTQLGNSGQMLVLLGIWKNKINKSYWLCGWNHVWSSKVLLCPWSKSFFLRNTFYLATTMSHALNLWRENEWPQKITHITESFWENFHFIWFFQMNAWIFIYSEKTISYKDIINAHM